MVLPVGAGSPWVHVLSCTPHERSCTHSSSDHRLPLNAAWAERWRPCAATCGLCNTHHLSGMHVCPAQRCPHCQPHGLSSPRRGPFEHCAVPAVSAVTSLRTARQTTLLPTAHIALGLLDASAQVFHSHQVAHDLDLSFVEFLSFQVQVAL